MNNIRELLSIVFIGTDATMMIRKSTMARIGAIMLGGMLLCTASTANATFSNMTYNCDFVGSSMGETSCGPTPGKDGIPTFGHIGIWESWYAPGEASVTIHIEGTYTGDVTGDRVYYTLGIDKDVRNHSSRPFYGFDMMFSGPPNWEPDLMTNLPYLDTAGYFIPTMADYSGVWFDGMLPYDMTSKFWLAVIAPLEYVQGGMVNDQYTGTVHGYVTIKQITKVPEPGMLTLFGLGLAGLGFAQRKRAA